MVTTTYINGTVLADGRFRDDLTVVTRGARFARVQPAAQTVDADTRTVDLAGDYLLPGFIFQSVVIAGGYGTGRELVEFFLTQGPLGGLLGIGGGVFIVPLLIYILKTPTKIAAASSTFIVCFSSFTGSPLCCGQPFSL